MSSLQETLRTDGHSTKPSDVEAAAMPIGDRQKSEGWLARLATPAMWGEAAAALACLILALGLEKATPRDTYVLKETLYQHSYPYLTNSVPSWTVPLFSLLGPLVCFLAYRFIVRRPNREVLRLVITFVLAYFLTAAITNCLKLPVGRLRPNFNRACWPNGTMVFRHEDQWGGYAVCDPLVGKGDVEEVRKSWPSGHSSLSAAGLGFLTFFLLGQLRAFSMPPGGRAGRLWRFLVALLPGFGAIVVAVTRVLDYWHYPSDVLTGLAIGFLTSFFVYRLVYPPLTHRRSDMPWEAILEMEEHQQGMAAAGTAGHAALSG
ncbi:Lipid phosphate phosphatase 1 [Tetrabaena socialis]|uniref:Lipid phosphate phosphatase 1 n=1 Tax=Tetrabaena socialis TaxID=47790 RepID=A0A2J8ABD0_9CHLO|nr:Lipid phosphate phosphatase 1 [Tetrabaena socialis]|eukprot:PNH09835.1 Lipid phosphate phosphatase 1 [Tetrabaena socialis]